MSTCSHFDANVGVGVGFSVGLSVGLMTDADTDGFADTDAAAFVVVFAVFASPLDVLLVARLLSVDDVQPDTNKDADKINRTIIAVIGFNRIRLSKW